MTALPRLGPRASTATEPFRVNIERASEIPAAIHATRRHLHHGRAVHAFVAARGARALGFRITAGQQGFHVISPSVNLTGPRDSLDRAMAAAGRSLEVALQGLGREASSAR